MDSDYYLQWHITNHCDQRCRHCYQEDFSPAGDLDWAGLKKVADNLLAALRGWGKKACIHLTGGEPLLKPELFSLLAYLDRQPEARELGIITNGLLLDPGVLEGLASLGKLKKIKISLDGAGEAVNGSIRPRGTFERVVRSVGRVREKGEQEVILMFTVMKRNLGNLPSFLRLARDLGADGLIIERFIPWGRGREIREEVLSGQEWRQMVRTLYESFSIEMGEDEISPYQAFQVDFRGGAPELLGAPCVLGTDGLCVMPGGDVYPCRRFPLAIGNLLHAPLEEIWEKSPVLEKVRKRENLGGKCGSCVQEGCAGCRSLAYCLTGDFLAEDPHCGRPPSPGEEIGS